MIRFRYGASTARNDTETGSGGGLVLSTISWKYNTDGNWSNAANWSGGVLPGAADTVVLDTLSAHTITFGSITATIGALSAITDTLRLSSGSLSILGTASFGQNLNANGGTLSLTGSVSGVGTVGIGQDSTLVASGSLSAANVTFLSSGGMLDLGLPASMTGTIEDFATTDTIDLLKTVVKVKSFVNDTLTLTGASGTFALHFSGDYSGYKFAVFSDGHGGTELLLT